MEKLETNLDLNLGQVLRTQLGDNFEKIQVAVDGQGDTLNKQILDMLGGVPLASQNEVTQARIDRSGKPYKTLKSRGDADQATAETALNEGRETKSEVIEARSDNAGNGYSTLKNRLDHQDSEIDTKLSQISLTPEVFANSAALKSTYPSGKAGIFITSDNGHKYLWSNGSWVDGGVYQAVGLADGVVDSRKIAKRTDVTNQMTVLANRYISTSNVNIAYITSPNFFVTKIPVLPQGTMRLPILPIDAKFIAATLADGNTLVFEKTVDELNAGGSSFTRQGYTVTDSELVIDMQYVFNQLTEKYIYIAQPYTQQSQLYVKVSKEQYLTDLMALSDTNNVTNKALTELSNEYLPVDIKPLYRQRNISWNTTTGELNFGNSDVYAAMELTNLPDKGLMKFKQTVLDSGQFIMLFDNTGKVIANFGTQYNDGTKTLDFLYLDGTDVVFDFKKALIANPKMAKMQITQMRGDIFTFKPVFYGVKNVSEVLKWADATNETQDELMLPSVYPVMNGKTANVVLTNLLKSGSVYDDKNVIATKTLGTQKIGLVEAADTQLGVKTRNEDPYQYIPVQRVDATKNGGNKSVMIIGESTSESLYLLDSIRDRLASDATKFTLVGTRVKDGVSHEARSGWGAGALHYVDKTDDTGNTNSFYNPEKKEFDWAWYLTQNNMAAPDIVVINFGLNDPNRYVTNGTSLSQTDHYNFFISQIRAVKPDTVIVIGLTHIYSSFGNFRNDARRDNIAALLNQTIQDFDNRTDERIYIAPYYLNIDTLWDMQYQQIPANEYQPERVDYIGIDHFHPSEIGYKKMADVMYAAIKQTI
ncbi:prophage protein [Leuconostoc kimchii IMSNU 11154]|uniref:Prophage protein n=1 Tax=Leuconostoc kimchii (strain IMSNU 11154 / KCTC 2386 / IH25) TaxID=762051 RepID=D5T4L7_LEUKI|nr:SGNH/GDSL hydrolase family protein [Leuconostoc kimchii]ADG41488.1 prophage protein [Leuconostoc kimchii IMSNU 11154]